MSVCATNAFLYSQGRVSTVESAYRSHTRHICLCFDDAWDTHTNIHIHTHTHTFVSCSPSCVCMRKTPHRSFRVQWTSTRLKTMTCEKVSHILIAYAIVSLNNMIYVVWGLCVCKCAFYPSYAITYIALMTFWLYRKPTGRPEPWSYIQNILINRFGITCQGELIRKLIASNLVTRRVHYSRIHVIRNTQTLKTYKRGNRRHGFFKCKANTQSYKRRSIAPENIHILVDIAMHNENTMY